MEEAPVGGCFDQRINFHEPTAMTMKVVSLQAELFRFVRQRCRECRRFVFVFAFTLDMIRIVWDFEALNCGYKFATCTSFMMKDAKEGTADISTMQGLLAHLVKVVSSMMVWLGHKSRG